MENDSDPRADYDPRDALADVAASRASVADRLITPWWYHPTLGAILAAIVLAGALDLPNLVRLPIALASALGIGMLVGVYQRITGIWLDARHLGPTSRRWWIAYTVIASVAVGISLIPLVTDRPLAMWFAIVLTTTVLVATVALGRRIDAAMRTDLRSGAITPPVTGGR